jgi:hypothetical protein
MSNDRSGMILEEIGEDETIGPTDLTLTDLRLLGPAGLIALVFIGKTPDQLFPLGIILGGGLLVFTGAIIWLSPSYRPAHKWIYDRYTHARTNTIMRPHDPTTTDNAQTLTQVDRFLRHHGSAKRVDGALVGAIEILAPSMALADREAWEAADDRFTSFVNNLSFPIQIHSTGQHADPKRLTRGYRKRLNDPDDPITDNEHLRNLLETYCQEFPREFERRGTNVRRFYIIVSVTELEIKLREQEGVSELGRMPVIGGLFRTYGQRKSDLSQWDINYYQKQELDRRLDEIRSSVNTHLTKCDSRDVDNDALSALLEEFWTGQQPDYSSKSNVERIRRLPVVYPADEDSEEVISA